MRIIRGYLTASAKQLDHFPYLCRRCASSFADTAASKPAVAATAGVPTGIQWGRLISQAAEVHDPQASTSNRKSKELLSNTTRTSRRRRSFVERMEKNAVLPSKPMLRKSGKSARQSTLADIDPDGPIPVEPPKSVPVPELAHGLDRVLFNPGVYYLQDPRSNVYNFDPYLQEITPVEEFNFDALTQYITSSRDSTLDELARAHNLKVVGSTSSMTSVLAQFHFFISNWRQVDVRRLSTAFSKKLKTFTTSQRAPASIYLRPNNGVYAIDADKSLDSGETILSFLGRSMEKMLTLAPEQFSKLRKENRAHAPTEKSGESYHYSKLGNLLMRSQLDCHDSRLPGTGTFDLKTRAVLPVRLDVKNAAQGAGYQIFQSVGLLESFEREYYDMIRAAFLKYSLQVRIGKMDGIFVAFHNTERIFGFQYISLDEMDEAIHGASSQKVATQEFNMSLRQLDAVLATAIETYPDQPMCLTFSTREDKTPTLDIIIEPLSEEAIIRRQRGEVLEALKAAQNTQLKKVAEKSAPGTLEKMSSTLEKMIGKENQDRLGKPLQPTTDHEGESRKDMLMLRLIGQNSIDGQEQSGPPNPTEKQEWKFTYTTNVIRDQTEIATELKALREKQAFAFTDVYDTQDDRNYFLDSLKKVADRGRVKLREREVEQEGIPPVVWRDRGVESSKTMEKQYRAHFTT